MREHHFLVTLADAEGRIQSSVISHKYRPLTAPVINNQLKDVGGFQPIAVTNISYLGKMSAQYYGTGSKAFADRAGVYSLIALATLCAALVTRFYFWH